jgi:uncharacterized phage-associated protein
LATVHDVAAAVLERTGAITAMKLEKLVYYCQGWHLGRHHARLFAERIEAWREGPVVPDLYQRHRQQYSVASWPTGQSGNLSQLESATVDWVVRRYGEFSAIELSRMTHNELPWREARGALPENANSTVPVRVEIIEEFYSRQIADPETAVAHAVSNAALEGERLDPEWQERLRDVAMGTLSADELVAQEIERLKN